MDKKTNNVEKAEVAVTGGFAGIVGIDILKEAMVDDCMGLDFQPDRIKIPAGGATAFELPGEDDEESQMAKDVTGVILHNHPVYSRYIEKYTGGSNPPDCGSYDGITGIGNPGGECASCYYNQFGSGEGQSKACQNRRMLYILQEGELFPLVLSLPTGSLREFTKYVKRQLSKGRRLSQVVTKISLKKASSGSGIAFSQAVFSMDRVLTAEEKIALEPLTAQMRAYASNLIASAAMPEDKEGFIDAETGEVIEALR